jgi:hypothetical protein
MPHPWHDEELKKNSFAFPYLDWQNMQRAELGSRLCSIPNNA